MKSEQYGYPNENNDNTTWLANMDGGNLIRAHGSHQPLREEELVLPRDEFPKWISSIKCQL